MQKSGVRLSRSKGGDIAMFLLLLLFALFFAFPLYYAIINSLKPIDEIFLFPPRFFVRKPTLGNFAGLFSLLANSSVPFTRYFTNSVVITVLITVLTILISSAAAYPLSKGNFYGKNLLFKFIVTALLFTTQVTSTQLYIVISKLGLIDTYWAILLPAISGSFGVFLLKQFMDGIPHSLIEAAKIDGCTELQILFKIIIPVIKPAWLTLGIFSFQSSWSTAGGGFIFSEELKFLPTAISQVISGGAIARVGVGSASTVILMIPPLVFFIIAQSNVLETMASAGIKE